MRYFEKLVLAIAYFSKAVAAFGIAGGVALAFINVIARYIFEASLTWAGELTIYLFLWSVFFGAVYCFYKDAHIAVDILLLKVPPKVAKILTLISIAVAFVYVSAIAYYGYEYVKLYIELEERSIDLDIPLWIPYSVVPISFGLSAIILIYKFIKVWQDDNFRIKSEAEEIVEEFAKEIIEKKGKV
ncbi:MAG: TRAP transporter small permease [Epsilonproteobacteria bacterium]|nr:TRAP transporter small permease [Campylobacterota bacterium]